MKKLVLVMCAVGLASTGAFAVLAGTDNAAIQPTAMAGRPVIMVERSAPFSLGT